MNQQILPKFNKADKFNDPTFNALQTLYGNFSKIAREVVILPMMHLYNGIPSHMSVLQRKILWNQNLRIFNLPYEVKSLDYVFA
jgi:hypothetical protein